LYTPGPYVPLAEQLCVRRARELNAARDRCRQLSLSENEVAIVERCVPESGVAESSIVAAATWEIGSSVLALDSGRQLSTPQPISSDVGSSSGSSGFSVVSGRQLSNPRPISGEGSSRLMLDRGRQLSALRPISSDGGATAASHWDAEDDSNSALTYQHGVEAAARIDAAIGHAASHARFLADDIATAARVSSDTSAASDAARHLAARLEAFTKHPNPSRPGFYEDLRSFRDAARDLAQRSEESRNHTEGVQVSFAEQVKRLEDTVADAKSQVPTP